MNTENFSPLQENIINRLNRTDYKKFTLPKRFVNKYAKIKPPFGFNGLGELVYRRTYSRTKADGTNEQWFETVERVVNGTYNMQKRWVIERGLPWSEHKAIKSAEEMYDRMFNMKFLPPGRGLWAMGSSITEERGLYAALNNCSFVSTENITEDYAKPFVFLMDMSMLGVGVGFDTKGAGKMSVLGPNKKRQKEIYIIPDTREGWVNSVEFLIDSYFKGTSIVDFDYSQIRKEGVPIKGFGGISSGATPLIELHSKLREILDKQTGEVLSVTTIVDIMNLIGKCVVSGNVRRTAEIAFGEYSSEEYLDLKNYKINPHRDQYGWTSNNSIFAERGMDYTNVAERTRLNGEPGYAWLENMKRFSRMRALEDNKDYRAAGGNPCLEQTLESYELCCLVENFPNRHDTLEDFLRTLKFSYLYAKTVTLAETHWSETNRVMLRNRRIGCSVSGIAQFLAKRGIGELKTWLEDGYDIIQKHDTIYSDWLCVPKSIKTTSVKPSGSVSLLAGATPGVHFPISQYYIRRMRLGVTSELVPILKKSGFHVEPAYGNEKTTVVVEVPVDTGDNIRSDENVTMWEKLCLAAFMQRYWADNQVSCTVTFDPNSEGKDIAFALDYFQWCLKGISFLPRSKNVYKQMPYESITKKRYQQLTKKIKKLDFTKANAVVEAIERFCDGEVCEITK